jgi:predicted acetyltransferase
MNEVRPIHAAEIGAWAAQLGVGFHFEVGVGFADYFLSTIDVDRCWASFDRDRVVGTLRSFTTALTVPGPRQARASALTNVTVAPTHRRQGRLTTMIEADLRASVEREETVSILIASEYPIYGHFGYGPAIESASYTVLKRETRFLEPVDGTVELSDRATLRREGPGIYDRFRVEQPGSIERPGHWWDRVTRQVEVPGDEPAKGQVVLYRSATGQLEGYARYEAKQDWEGMRPQGALTLHELVGVTPEAYRALWAYCCGIDLLTTIDASLRPTDEVLPYLLEDARAVKLAARFDFLWVRVLDVCAALAGRTYATPGRLVIEVVDELGIAGGRYLLEGSPDGAQCVPTTESPGLTMPVDALGSVYLGGVAARTLELGARMDEHQVGAVSKADAMFRTGRAPWCNTWF